MGYDVSFHPVDLPMIHGRIIPFLQGRRDLDDLAGRAARVVRNHVRANCWAAGLLKFIGHDPAALPGLHPDLFAWGRPFFITRETPAEVSEAIDRYLSADVAGVDELAREMLRELDPGLLTKVAPEPPDIPRESDIFEDLRSRLNDLQAEYVQAMATRRRLLFKTRLRASDFATTSLRFTALFRPGWMDRGHVWPSRLLRDAGIACDLFRPADALYSPLLADGPPVVADLADTIIENHSVGGYVAAEDVGALQSIVDANESRLRERAVRAGDPEGISVTLRKIREALHDARYRHLPFVEASEIV